MTTKELVKDFLVEMESLNSENISILEYELIDNSLTIKFKWGSDIDSDTLYYDIIEYWTFLFNHKQEEVK